MTNEQFEALTHFIGSAIAFSNHRCQAGLDALTHEKEVLRLILVDEESDSL